jgi:hypothetical protein
VGTGQPHPKPAIADMRVIKPISRNPMIGKWRSAAGTTLIRFFTGLQRLGDSRPGAGRTPAAAPLGRQNAGPITIFMVSDPLTDGC